LPTSRPRVRPPRQPLVRTLAWPVRTQRLGELGFSPQQAHDLCDARDSAGQLVDLHEIADALAGGCDTDTAYAIYA
jgi:hypothetical protein